MTQSAQEPAAAPRRAQERAASRTVEGRVPPHDLRAEAAVDAAIMLRGSGALDEVVDDLSPEDFYSEANRRVFEAARELAANGTPIDELTVEARLRDTQRLAQVGGAAYLLELVQAAPEISTEHLRAYARRVKSKSRQRRFIQTMQEAIYRCYVGVPDDEVEALFEKVEREVMGVMISKRRGEFEQIGYGIKRVVKGIDEHAARGGGIVGKSYGYHRLDNMTGGIHEGDLTIVGGRPGMGKSAFVANVAENVTEPVETEVQDAVAIFSLEMPRDQFIARMLCSRGRANLVGMRTGKFSAEERRRIEHAGSDLYNRGIFIDDTPGLTIPEMRTKLRKLILRCTRMKRRLRLVIVDYLQLMNPEQGRGESRANAIGRLSRDQKGLAKELSVAFMTLAQLNRESESRDEKRPRISDLRDSGEIEQDADNIFFLYRDDYYDADSLEQNVAEIIVAKQRNGPQGVAKVRFDKQWTRFDNISCDDYEPEQKVPLSPSRQYVDTRPEAPVSSGMPGDEFFGTEGM